MHAAVRGAGLSGRPHAQAGLLRQSDEGPRSEQIDLCASGKCHASGRVGPLGHSSAVTRDNNPGFPTKVGSTGCLESEAGSRPDVRRKLHLVLGIYDAATRGSDETLQPHRCSLRLIRIPAQQLGYQGGVYVYGELVAQHQAEERVSPNANTPKASAISPAAGGTGVTRTDTRSRDARPATNVAGSSTTAMSTRQTSLSAWR